MSCCKQQGGCGDSAAPPACPAGSSAPCNPSKCCPSGDAAACGPAKCCPGGNVAACGPPKCCPSGSVAANAPPPKCCPGGNAPACAPPKCCPGGNVAACGPPKCCPGGDATVCAPPKCCPTGAAVSSGPPKCCPGAAACGASKCCPGGKPCGPQPAKCCPTENADEKTKEIVKEYYGKVLTTSKDLKTSACCAAARPPPHVRDALKAIPEEILAKFYGCGSPIPPDIEGLTVLDLGSGAGRDCYVAAKLVGPKGKVIGIDMTNEQLEVAIKYSEEYCTKALGYPASILDFREGYIECLLDAGVLPNSVDLIISNCVVNLSPNKEAVLQSAAKALRKGGELYFNDVYADRRIPSSVAKHEVLWGECIAGALYIEDFKRMARRAGFTDPRILQQTDIKVTDPELLEVVGEVRFFSILFRCFKIDDLEDGQEDYGQVAIYKGGIPGSSAGYTLDVDHHFTKGKPVLVSGNTASILQQSRVAPHFEVLGDRTTHYGTFTSSSPVKHTTDVPPSSAPSCC